MTPMVLITTMMAGVRLRGAEIPGTRSVQSVSEQDLDLE
jgi:hypothetical protein